MDPAQIKDPKLRKRIADADAAQNKPKPQGLSVDEFERSYTQTGKRLRQSSKPLMNKLESEFYARLLADKASFATEIRIQARRYRLGNGIWYKPDFTASRWPWPGQTGQTLTHETAWEVKGPKAFRGGFENLKVAASLYPEIRWLLVWKNSETGQWQEQPILP